MNGIRFYQEFKDKSKVKPAGTVVALLVCNGPFRSDGTVCYEADVGLFDHPNSAVCSSAVSLDYLRCRCKRIGQAKARTMHPALFERLDHR